MNIEVKPTKVNPNIKLEEIRDTLNSWDCIDYIDFKIENNAVVANSKSNTIIIKIDHYLNMSCVLQDPDIELYEKGKYITVSIMCHILGILQEKFTDITFDMTVRGI